jgi:lipid-A-disaccharide synthase
MANVLDGLAVIFPFEVKCYQDVSLPVSFVGHPFVGGDYSSPVSYDEKGPLLLLPGSRVNQSKESFLVFWMLRKSSCSMIRI